MNISTKRSAGFAGITEDIGTINTRQLDRAVAQRIEQCVQSVDFFNLPMTISGTGAGADLFQYEITISEGTRKHTVVFEDDNSPETAPLHQLVELLIQVK
jgi:emfourin